MSAHDLLSSGLFPNSYNQSNVDVLLAQAKSLATGLKLAFKTNTGLPAGDVNFTTQTLKMTNYTLNNVTYNGTNTAQAGTFILEWYRLSDLTGDESFRQIVSLPSLSRWGCTMTMTRPNEQSLTWSTRVHRQNIPDW